MLFWCGLPDRFPAIGDCFCECLRALWRDNNDLLSPVAYNSTELSLWFRHRLCFPMVANCRNVKCPMNHFWVQSLLCPRWAGMHLGHLWSRGSGLVYLKTLKRGWGEGEKCFMHIPAALCTTGWNYFKASLLLWRKIVIDTAYFNYLITFSVLVNCHSFVLDLGLFLWVKILLGKH